MMPVCYVNAMYCKSGNHHLSSTANMEHT